MRAAIRTATILGLTLMALLPHPVESSSAPVRLLANLGSYHRPIATSNPEAQRFFDQGLTLVYGFNYEEAIRSFERAAQLDPIATMPLWGIAIALGPNINDPGAKPRMRAAYQAVQRARVLAMAAPERERRYVDALARRYSPAGDVDASAYKDAMAALVQKYPDDLDAAVIYAEALMDIRPWRLWSNDGKAADGTDEVIAVLESVLRRDPLHPGANHYYIHALEASPFPERALPSATRLQTLVPGAGHLVHMPAHIYMRTGDYAAASSSTAEAERVDEAYIREAGATGMYPVAYYTHNLRFLAAAASMQGRYVDAKRAADALVRAVESAIDRMPMAEMLLPAQAFVLARFQKWREILMLPEPPPDRVVMSVVRHYARAVAYAAMGDVSRAGAERDMFGAARKAVPVHMMLGNNSSAAIFDLAALVVDARILGARGDRPAAIDVWRKAAAAQDALWYGEPSDWYYPVRESLGAALLRNGQASEAEGAFRDDLGINPRNGRSLFGLWQSLEAQRRSDEAALVRQQFRRAWENADVELRIEDL
jgi:tetratricopeptide (TPR) repeat protein